MRMHDSYPERQMYFVEKGECNIILKQYNAVSSLLIYVQLRTQFDPSRPLHDASQESPPNKNKTQDSVDVVLKNLKVTVKRGDRCLLFCFKYECAKA